MARTKHKIQKGDKVNDQARFKAGKGANGFVYAVLFADDGPEEVIVKFDDGTEIYDYHDFTYAWTDSLGGVYQLT